jgi:hypothetical protein
LTTTIQRNTLRFQANQNGKSALTEILPCITDTFVGKAKYTEASFFGLFSHPIKMQEKHKLRATTFRV